MTKEEHGFEFDFSHDESILSYSSGKGRYDPGTLHIVNIDNPNEELCTNEVEFDYPIGNHSFSPDDNLLAVTQLDELTESSKLSIFDFSTDPCRSLGNMDISDEVWDIEFDPTGRKILMLTNTEILVVGLAQKETLVDRTSDLRARLVDIKKLLDQGVITQEEYDMKREQILEDGI